MVKLNILAGPFRRSGDAAKDLLQTLGRNLPTKPDMEREMVVCPFI